MPQRWRIEIAEVFWDALIQLPGWPQSGDAVSKLLVDLTRYADKGDRIVDTTVYIARTVAVLPDDETVRLLVYYSWIENSDVVTVLWVDNENHPFAPLDPKTHRFPKSGFSH